MASPTTVSEAAEFDVASPRIDSAIVMVDPATALRWLSRNKKNRNVRQSVVARYRADMAEGRWTFAADPVRFDTDGNLIDGQHRLTALSELDKGVTIPMLVVRGLPADAQDVMDQGVKRTPGDQLALHGIKHANRIAAAIKQFIAWDSGYLFRDNKLMSQISATRVVEWAEANPGDVAFLQRINSLTRQNDAPPSIAEAAAIAFGRIDAEAAVEFFTLLARGAGTAGHPIVTLDKRLQSVRRNGVKMPYRDYLGLFILAWNAWRDDRQMAKFQRPAGGRWSESNFPEPH